MSYKILKSENFLVSIKTILGIITGIFFRLTPQVVLYMSVVFLLPLGTWRGPLYKETIGTIIDNCSSNWWRNLFYIQNFYQSKSMCGIHTWFLSVYFQYHVLTLALYIILHKYFAKSFTRTSIILVAISFLLTIVIGVCLDIPPGLINTGRDEHFYKVFFDHFYMKPWSHYSVFLIGMALGPIFTNLKPVKLSMVRSY